MQSFETANLRELRTQLRVRLVQLLEADGTPADRVAAGDPRGYADMITPAGLAEIAGYADVIGPDKDQVIPRDADGALTEPSALVHDAHAAGLLVHPYTFRNEPSTLASNYEGNPVNEYLNFYEIGVDGVFSDFPNTAFAARELFWLQNGEWGEPDQ